MNEEPVDSNGISSRNITFAVNRLTHEQFIRALENTNLDKTTNQLGGPITANMPYLLSNEFYMTVDEDVNADFQLSSYVTLVDFYQAISGLINFRGITHDDDWLSSNFDGEDPSVPVTASPSDLYVHYKEGAVNPDAPYLSAAHGDMVFHSPSGREFMYTRVVRSDSDQVGDMPSLRDSPATVGFWSELGDDLMLSTVKAVASVAIGNISGYIDYLNNYTSGYLSTQIHNHITSKNNPHSVTAGQVQAYLCSQTSSAA